MNFNARFHITKMWIKIIALIAISELQTWRIWSDAGKIICRTHQCYDLAIMYRQAINLKGKPCNNFFDYACQKWGKHHIPAYSTSFWNVNQVLQQEAAADLRRIMKQVKSPNPVQKLAIRLYEDCMKRPSLGYIPPGDAKDIIRQLYYWPMFVISKTVPATIKWWTVDRYYMELTGESTFFEVNFIANIQKTDISLQLFEPISAYGSIIRQTKWLPEELDNYKLYLTDLIKIVAPTNTISIQKDTFDGYLDEVIEFRRKLDNVRRCCGSDNYEEITFKHFQKFYESHITNSPNALVNWPSYFRGLRGSQKNSPLNDDFSIIIRKPFFVKFISLLEKTPLTVLINHIHIFFAERHTLVNSSLQKLLGKTIVSAGLQRSGHLRILPPKKDMCIYKNSLRKVLEDMYTAAHFSPQMKTTLNNMFTELKDTLVTDIWNSSWLSHNLKDNFTRKIRGMSISVSNNLKSSSVKEFVLASNAHYSIKNSIFITAPLLQLPIFGVKLPAAINYATMGSLLAHEMFHAFDTRRVFMDGSGNPFEWSAEMADSYKNQSKCFEEKYRQHKEMWLLQYGIKHDFSALSTINEDIADAMGLQLAYKVYREQARESKGVCQLLPGFEKFNCDMLFFVAFANTYCSISSVTHDIRKHITAKHSTSHVRINAAVANMPEFATAFSCKPGDYLYTRKRCNLWN